MSARNGDDKIFSHLQTNPSCGTSGYALNEFIVLKLGAVFKEGLVNYSEIIVILARNCPQTIKAQRKRITGMLQFIARN